MVSLEQQPLKYQICGKPLITFEPPIGKFQNWVEMKVIYPTNKKNTHRDFSDNFHNIKNFVQVDRIDFLKIIHNEKQPDFSFFSAVEKPPAVGKFFQMAKVNPHICQIIV